MLFSPPPPNYRELTAKEEKILNKYIYQNLLYCIIQILFEGSDYPEDLLANVLPLIEGALTNIFTIESSTLSIFPEEIKTFQEKWDEALAALVKAEEIENPQLIDSSNFNQVSIEEISCLFKRCFKDDFYHLFGNNITYSEDKNKLHLSLNKTLNPQDVLDLLVPDENHNHAPQLT